MSLSYLLQWHPDAQWRPSLLPKRKNVNLRLGKFSTLGTLFTLLSFLLRDRHPCSQGNQKDLEDWCVTHLTSWSTHSVGEWTDWKTLKGFLTKCKDKIESYGPPNITKRYNAVATRSGYWSSNLCLPLEGALQHRKHRLFIDCWMV